MMKLQMYDSVADNIDAAIYAKKKNDASCECIIQLWMYKKRMLKNKLQKGVVKLKYVPREEQVADMLTKPLAHVKFEYFQDKFGVVQFELTKPRFKMINYLIMLHRVMGVSVLNPNYQPRTKNRVGEVSLLLCLVSGSLI